ncbi:MAG: SDR family oxidoreductase [Planctomycetota bacterium]
MQTLASQHVMLTGATSGIGRALAVELKREGVRLAACGRSSEKLAELTEELAGVAGPPALLRSFCVSSEEAICGFARESEASHGPVDILINCAGLNAARGPVAEIRTEDLDWMYTVNVRAPMVFIRETFPAMRKRGRGQIVNIVSTVCLYSNEGLGGYTASKAALDGLTKVLRKEARPLGIRVMAVYPGGTNTAFRPNERADYMTPRSVAEAVVAMLKLDADAVVHELVLRPMVESNF